jgi:hypothetical protein
MGTFHADLKLGQKAELYFTQRFKAWKPDSMFTFNNAKDLSTLREYDVLLNGKIKIEVKHDARALETGSVFIEFNCLECSTSHYFAYQIGDVFYGLKTSSLRWLCRNYDLIFFRGLGKYAYLIPLETFILNSEKI